MLKWLLGEREQKRSKQAKLSNIFATGSEIVTQLEAIIAELERLTPVRSSSRAVIGRAWQQPQEEDYLYEARQQFHAVTPLLQRFAQELNLCIRPNGTTEASLLLEISLLNFFSIEFQERIFAETSSAEQINSAREYVYQLVAKINEVLVLLRHCLKETES